MSTATSSLPGRLGDPQMSLATDPRTHPQLLKALKKHALHDLSYLTSDLKPDAPIGDAVAFVSANEKAIEGLYNSLDYAIPEENTPSTPIEASEIYIGGSDNGNQIRLVIRRPSAITAEEPKHKQLLPAVVYFHGGGMVILSTDNPMHTTWAEALTRTGLVTITVDFRNALDPSRPGRVSHPFPAGLDDCCAAVRWVHAHRADLGISKVVLHGESGGANLAMAVALRAKKEGWLWEEASASASASVDTGLTRRQRVIDGVCVSVPYISNAYGLPEAWRRANLPSLVECDGYLISCATSVHNARLYDPSGKHARDPLAWPYWATEDDVEGLPPHLIVTNELDPLRDEGHAYLRTLLRAGVPAVGRVNLGMIHEGELFLRQTVPEVFRTCLWEVRKFVDGV